jgi:hypothetical protein
MEQLNDLGLSVSIASRRVTTGRLHRDRGRLPVSRRSAGRRDRRSRHACHPPRAFEQDRRQDQLLRLSGWTVIRFTYNQVVNRPDEVLATLARLLHQ